jgi:IS5 family transposase
MLQLSVMKPMTFAGTGFERYTKKTRRQAFLEEMDRIVPWSVLSALVEKHYPKGEVGRPPIGVERMLRIMFLQHWFNLSDPGIEEALYDTLCMRAFAHIDLGRERVPDETTICKFRHLIERCDLSGSIFEAVAMHLAENGIVIRSGTIVDATILDAPSSTKNQAKERDPEMHQTRKGNEWFFGMKGHIGVDSRTKVIHSVVATPANVHDSRVLGDLLHGKETRVWGDSAYIGQRDVIRAVAPKAKAFINKRATRGKALSDADRAKNRNKSRVRAKGEHPFLVMKRVFPFTKLRYRGIEKNATWLFIRSALVNLFTQRRILLRLQRA